MVCRQEIFNINKYNFTYNKTHHYHPSRVMTLIDLFRPRLVVSAKVSQVFFGLLFYNSPLFLASSCSCLLNVVGNLICIFFISHPLVLLSSLPEFIYLFCHQKVYIPLLFWNCSSRWMSFVFNLFVWRSTFRFHVEEWGPSVHYTPLFVQISGPKLVEKCCLEFPLFAYNNQYKHTKFKTNIK